MALFMTTPKQKPGNSKQDYGTPPEFFRAVSDQFGPMVIDLAAREDNKLCDSWVGPGSYNGADSLKVEWSRLMTFRNSVAWLNPPFADLRPWARKCAQEASRDRRIVMLTPASLGSEWYCDEVQGRALTLVVRPRMTFVGCTDPYPKDLAIHLFGFRMVGLGTWKWK